MEDTARVLSENTVKSYRLSYAQFNKWCAVSKVKKVTEMDIAAFIKASHEGYPNDKPKKPSALGIKYKGIIHCLNEQGIGIAGKRNFVATVLGTEADGVETSDDELTDEEATPVATKSTGLRAVPTSAVRAPKK